MSEPWEPYYRIAADVDPAVRKLLEDSLRFIAGAADGEGMALMRKAYALNQNRPIEIQAVRSDITQSRAGEPGVIVLELGEVETVRFGEVEHATAPSMTGILVHEMYHKADPHVSVLNAALVSQNAMDERTRHHFLVTKVVEFVKALQQNKPEMIATHGLAEEQVERAVYRKVFDEAIALSRPEKAYVLAQLNPAALDRLRRAGFYVANDIPQHEDEAVRFTDAFMAKNGCDEPWRGHYFNARELKGGETPSAIRAAQCGGLNESLGFIPFIPDETLKANALGDLTPPQVKAVTREEVRRGK